MSGNGYDYPLGGGGGSVNPTSLRMPINVGGVFLDSLLYEDATRRILSTTTGLSINTFTGDFILGDTANFFAGNLIQVGASSTFTRFANENKGFYLGLDGPELNYFFGDFGGQDNGSSLLIDDKNRFITTGRKLKTNSPEAFGLYVNTNNGNTILGDVNGIFPNQLKFNLEQTTGIFYTSTGSSSLGLKLDFSNNQYAVGDFDLTNNGSSFIVDVVTSQIFTKYAGKNYGLFLDLSNGISSIGDVGYTLNGITINVDDVNQVVYASQLNIANGLSIDFRNHQFLIGDIAGLFQSTYFGVDDNLNTLTGSNVLLTPTASGNSGQHLKIRIGNTDYVIQLLNA